jgi:hypothetical protein
MHSHFCRTPPCGDSRPMGQSGGSAGLQMHRSGVLKSPRGLTGCVIRRAVGRPLRESGSQERRGSPVCAVRNRSTMRRASEAARPRGERDAVCRRRLPRDSAGAWDRSTAATVKIETMKNWSTSPRLLAAMVRWGSSDCEAVERLSTQIVRKQAKAICRRRPCTLQSRHQRLPRV